MHSKRILTPVLFVLFLLGCDPTTIKYSSMSGFNQSYENQDCAIIISDAFTIDYQGDTENEFGPGRSDVQIKKFFKEQFPKTVAQKTTFSNVSLQTGVLSYSRQAIHLQVNGRDSVTIIVPQDGTKLYFNQQLPSYILFLGDVSITSSLELNSGSSIYIPGSIGFGGGSWQGSAPSSSKDLVIATKFALWNNIEGNLISYGYVQAVDENAFAVSIDDWHNAINTLVTKMFAQLPTQN